MRTEQLRAPTPWSTIIALLAVVGLWTSGCTFDTSAGQQGADSVESGADATPIDDTETADAGDTDQVDPEDTGMALDTGSTGNDTAECPKDGACDDTGSDTAAASDGGKETSTADDTTVAEDTSGSEDTSVVQDTCASANCGMDTSDPTVDPTGRWVAKGYSCRGDEPIQVIDINYNPNNLVAEKKLGDDCVGSGEKTFRTMNPGTLRPGDTLSVEVETSGPNSRTETLEVRSGDKLTISGLGIEFARVDTSNLSSTSITGTWKSMGLKCNVNNPPTGEMDVAVPMTDHVATATSGDHCADKWEGTRGGRASFPVEITGTDRNGNTITVSGTVEILAQEFIHVTIDNIVTEIRMWAPSLF